MLTTIDVRFDDRRYAAAHGCLPQGRAEWMFDAHVTVDGQDEEHTLSTGEFWSLRDTEGESHHDAVKHLFAFLAVTDARRLFAARAKAVRIETRASSS